MRVGVVGGGIFGAIIAREFGRAGHQVVLYEASSKLLSRASLVNQARLHTGLHYPRSLETALEAKQDHDRFIESFPSAVTPINQFYAIATDSQLNFDEFREFASRLGHQDDVENPSRFFKEGTVEGMLRVRESSFDAEILRRILVGDLESIPRVTIELKSLVLEIDDSPTPRLRLGDGWQHFDKIIVATYAMNSKLALGAEVEFPAYENQLTQVLLGNFPGLKGTGVTVMDGPYWSTMPFGQTGLHSLTAVEHTPISSSVNALLPCQELHSSCGKLMIAHCGTCRFRPEDKTPELLATMRSFLLPKLSFVPVRSIFTVKSLPHGTHYKETAARPSQVVKSATGNTTFVHSGKIGSSLTIANQLVRENTGL